MTDDDLLSETQLFGQWRDRWADFLTDIEESSEQDEVERKLRDKVTIGNAERRIAGGHEGREILELLQNARDAIRKGETNRGRVYIGVYDEGVMVANTGSRFDFFHPKVEKAVTMIGETGKGDDEDGQSIGHKGVGLKSILATGDSFEIYTRPELESEDILGVKLSRSYLLSALLDRLGHDVAVAESARQIKDSELRSLLQSDEETRTLSLNDNLRDSLSKLPLFNFPVPIDVRQSSDEVVERAERLLTESTEREQFRTAVFVRYEDDDWRDILSEFGIALPEEGSGSLEDRPDRIWNYLAQSASDENDGLRKETLVQLGGIESLRIERNSGGSVNAAEDWTVSRSGDTDPVDDRLLHQTVEVKIEAEETTEREIFDQFQLHGEGEYGVSLLVGKEATRSPAQYPREHPLYLYYPIQNTATTSFPFCLHGRFRVETNRKDLSNNNIEENRAVLEEGLDLVEAVSVETARADPDGGPYGSAYPWVLLPPIPDSVTDEPTTQSELLRWFCDRLYNRLRGNPNIALDEVGEAAPPGDTLLHWDERTVAGYQSLREVSTRDSTETDGVARRPLPAGHTIDAYREFPTQWNQRLRHLLLDTTTESEYTGAVVRDYAGELSDRLSDFDEPTVRVDAADGRNLLRGFAALVFGCTDGDDDIDSLLSDLSDELEGVYILPCSIPDSDVPEEFLQLVPIERRQSPQGERARGVQSRSVIWDLRSASRTTNTPPAPARATNFTVYFFDSVVEEDESVHKLLSLTGRLWGMRAYEGVPSFVRSLLDAFAFGSNRVIKPRDFAFLTAIVQELGQESTDLRTGEGSYFKQGYLNSAIQQSEGDQRRNLERRVRLRDCSIELPGQEGDVGIRETALGDGWQAQLLGEGSEDEESDEDASEFTSVTYPDSVWPEPSSESWEAILDIINRSVTETDIVRTLSLLGASAFPNMRVVWMYGDDHPDMRRPTNWNPTEWPEEEFGSSPPETVDDLIGTLESFDGAYQDWITAPGYHPQETAGHSKKCNVRLNGTLQETNVGAWIWCDDTAALQAQGEGVIELLRRHGDALLGSLLRTGWSCTNGHMRRDWTRTVPSLFNWQLRHLTAWEHVLSIHDDVAGEWGDERKTLAFAVQGSSSQGAQAARLFPSLDPDGDDVPGREVLNALGVRAVGQLNSTQAAYRLQKLQEVLADGELGEDPVRLDIPSGRDNDWNRAYTKLLSPLMNQLPDEDPASAELADGGFLTHFPLMDGEEWVAVPLDWLRQSAEDHIRYYEDQSPKPWERHAVNENNHYLLQRTSEGPFVRLARHLGVSQVEASKPIVSWQAAERRLVDDEALDEHLAECRQHLRERRDLLVASTERKQEDEVRNTAETLREAIDNLATLESFPEATESQLSDRASGLYQTAEGQTGLAFNLSECENPPQLSALAMGLALLVDRPTNLATFREALRQDISVQELETRWERLTFPIEAVQRTLGSELTREFNQRFTVLASLFDHLELDVELETDEAIQQLTDADSGVTEAARQWYASGGEPPEVLDGYDAVQYVGEQIRTSLPSSHHFILQHLFSPTEATGWQQSLEQSSLSSVQAKVVVEWLLDNASRLPRRPIDSTIRTGLNRLLTLVEVWKNTDVAELGEVRTWRQGARSFEGVIEVDWTQTAPSTVTTVEEPPMLFYFATDQRLREARDEFVSQTVSTLDVGDDEIGSAVRQYLSEGEFPERETAETGARQHQQEAFDDIQNQLASTQSTSMDGGFGPNGGRVIPVTGKLAVSEGSSSRGGGSRQYTGRGQQAEVYTIVSVLDRLSEWLDNSVGGIFRQFRNKFKQLHKAQQSTDYKWHVENAWQSGLLEALDDTSLIDEDELKDWRTTAQDRRLSSLPIVRLLNVTQEQGPGFDIIDPFGPLDTDLGREMGSLRFSPVEVKAVGGSEPPFHFRLTTNEYRRCRAFVSESDHPYIIRLVSIPEAGTPDWPQHAEFVSEKVIESPEELDELMGTKRFDRVVKGGYMNMSLE